MVGSRFSTDQGTGQAALRLNGGACINCILVGDRLIGWNAAIYNQSDAGLYLHGGDFETLNTGAGGVFWGTSTSAGAIRILSPVSVIQQNTSNSAVQIDGGSTMNVFGMMVDSPNSGIPSTPCYPGEQTLDTAGTHLYTCHPLNTWNTAW